MDWGHAYWSFDEPLSRLQALKAGQELSLDVGNSLPLTPAVPAAGEQALKQAEQA